jgi:hypothetical protein
MIDWAEYGCDPKAAALKERCGRWAENMNCSQELLRSGDIAMACLLPGGAGCSQA